MATQEAQSKKTSGITLVPEGIFPILSYLADKERLQAYKESLKGYSETARKTLDVFSFDEVIKGSNPFANVALASRDLALPSELELAVRINPEYFKGQYEDIALVLRTNGDSEFSKNDYLARHLFSQLKKRKISPTPENPVRISLKGLSLKEDSESPYGLVFRLGDAEVIQAPELSGKNHGKNFSRTDERAIPIFDAEGNSTFYARQTGLSWLVLGRDLGLYSNWSGGLADSYGDGRVVVTESAAGAQQKLGQLKARLTAAREEYKAKLSQLESEIRAEKDK